MTSGEQRRRTNYVDGWVGKWLAGVGNGRTETDAAEGWKWASGGRVAGEWRASGGRVASDRRGGVSGGREVEHEDWWRARHGIGRG